MNAQQNVTLQLDRPPEFYTNLDYISGKIVLWLARAEQIGSIVVKLEGESLTALQAQPGAPSNVGTRPQSLSQSNNTIVENHKLLYKVQQVFPDDYYATSANPYGSYPLPSGKHEFAFKFKVPINNACSDHNAMSRIGGLAGAGGYGAGPGLFGIGGIRVMDGTKQLFYRHTTQTLPPSLTGFPMQAEIRYFLKVTVQRPGFLKENWRRQAGLKFLPIEPPRPKTTGQEAFARRPFTFKPKSHLASKKSSFFKKMGKSEEAGQDSAPESNGDATAPSIEVSARLPHPSILSCNQPVPLRLLAKRLNSHPGDLYLISLQMDLIGYTTVRARHLVDNKVNRWVIISNPNLCLPLNLPGTEVGKEVAIPDEAWKGKALPNTVAPSFNTCNLTRRYELELKVGIAWGKPNKDTKSQAPAIYLPLHFGKVEVFSGINPPPELLQAAQNMAPGRVTLETPPRLPRRPVGGGPSGAAGAAGAAAGAAAGGSSQQGLGRMPSQAQAPAQPPRPPEDPLYPPQLRPGQDGLDEAPPSYDEAMAENLAGPFDGAQERPAYSGVTDPNAPSAMPRENRKGSGV